ncbi:MAG: ornithine carbamoyltransferase [Myxococcales bacterium]
MTNHFLTLDDLGTEGLLALLDRSAELKRLRGKSEHPRPLAGKSVGILLEKSSTRTRISFEVGVHELGGLPLTLKATDIQLGRGESIEDSARMFSRFLHAVVYRTFGHERVECLARSSSIPVINGLSDLHHPCQILADLLTVRENLGRVEGTRVAWIGDGNNVAHSWIEAATLLGFELILACPEGYDPHPEVLAAAKRRGRGRVEVVRDADSACRGADVVTTDVWVSMGQEGETKDRNKVFEGYAVDERRMELSSSHAIFLHCLPAHRGEEVTAAVIDGPRSRVWDEAENRLHTQKALLERLIQP